MFGLFENKDKPNGKENAVSETGKAYTLPPVPKLEIPEAIYAPIGAAIERWKKYVAELAAKRTEIPELEKGYEALAEREYAEDRLLKDERAEIRRKIEEAQDEVQKLERFMIPKALVHVWRVAAEATTTEAAYTKPHDERWRVFDKECDAILDEVKALKQSARPAVCMGRDFYSDRVSTKEGDFDVSEKTKWKCLRDVPRPPLGPPKPAPVNPGERRVLYTNPSEPYYPDGAVRKDVPPPRPEPIHAVTILAPKPNPDGKG
jgi:hypothetical protein